MMILIAGTAKSGKSHYAETRLEKLPGSPKIYMAMPKIIDEEMRERVKNHRAMRAGKGFITVEGFCLDEVPKNSAVLIESLTAWTAEEMFNNERVVEADVVVKKIYEKILRLSEKAEDVVIVADDIFSDGNVYDPLTENYVRALADLIVKISVIADEVVEIISGLAVTLKASEPHYPKNYHADNSTQRQHDRN